MSFVQCTLHNIPFSFLRMKMTMMLMDSLCTTPSHSSCVNPTQGTSQVCVLNILLSPLTIIGGLKVMRQISLNFDLIRYTFWTPQLVL